MNILQKFWQIILVIVGFVLSLFLSYNKGKQSEKAKQDKRLINNVITANKINQNTATLTRDELIDKL
jgi:predicted histidine transporter YuiF (NhaC family)